MINDLNNLEPVFGQFDPGKILIGPLLNLSLNSSFRFFYIAGNGNRIYESIALGFVEVESEAQRQRADIIAQLKTRFANVEDVDSQLALARAAHTFWPNEETTRFLAATALEAKLQATATNGQNEPSGDEPDETRGETRSETSQLQLGEELLDWVTEALDPVPNAPPGPPEQPQSMPTVQAARADESGRMPDAAQSWPLSGDPVETPQRRSALEQDDIALAVFELKSSTATVANTDAAAVLPANPPIATADVEDTDTVATSARRHAGRAAVLLYRFCAVGGAAALIAGIVIITGTHQIAREIESIPIVGQLISPDNDRSQTTASVAATQPQRHTIEAGGTTVRSPPASSTVLPQPAPEPHAAHSAPAVTVAAPQAQPKSAPPPSPASPASNAQTATAGEPAADPRQPLGRPAADAAAQSSPSPPQLTGGQSPPAQQSPAPPSNAPVPQPRATPDQPQSQPPRVANAEPKQSSVTGPESGATKGGGIAKPLSADHINALLDHGSEFVKNGDFAAARVLLRRAAEAGSADAALLLAKTFDPQFLNEVGAIGIQPDLAECRKWYQKAAELGSEAAAQRLADLAHTSQ